MLHLVIIVVVLYHAFANISIILSFGSGQVSTVEKIGSLCN